MTLETLLVEDHARIRDSLIPTLEALAPVRVAGVAESEAQALRWLDEHPTDWRLALVDLFLTEGSGVGVLQRLRARSAGQHVAVLTSAPTERIRAWCEELGADAVFDKSSELDALVAWCERCAGDGALPLRQAA